MQDYTAEAQGWLQIPTGSRAGQVFFSSKKGNLHKEMFILPFHKEGFIWSSHGNRELL